MGACAVYEQSSASDSLHAVQDAPEPDAQVQLPSTHQDVDVKASAPDARTRDAAPDANLTDTAVEPRQPPVGLACLATHYAGTARLNAGLWELSLASSVLPWDDGRAKTVSEAITSPDLEDTFRMPYAVGAITAVSSAVQDPGRVRVEPLFNATYGANEAAVVGALTSVDFLGTTVKFHRRAAPALTRVVTRLEAAVRAKPSLARYLVGEIGGTYVRRTIAGTPRISAHSYGVAIDIIVKYSSYWEWDQERTGSYAWRNQVPQEIVDAFEAEGFVWGGRWFHYDTMHFEYRPEFFDRTCWP